MRIAITFIMLIAAAARGAEAPRSASAAGADLFERKIRPVLAQECYRCHSASAEKLKANLLLDTRAGLLTGGDTGPAIVPGDPGGSLLIKAIRGEDKDLPMPPKTNLPAETVAALAEWVRLGAPWPGGRSSAAKPIAFPGMA